MKFTVMLRRPDYLSRDFPNDMYIAHVEADHPKRAIRKAQLEVYAADKKDGLFPNEPEDYALLFCCKGHVKAIYRGDIPI